MRKLLSIWLKNTEVNLVLLFLIFSLFSISSAFADDYSQGRSAGDTAGSSALQKLGSKSGIKSRISAPMTSGGVSQMSTLDNSQSFSASISAPSSDKYLELLIHPTATGDLSPVYVYQDIDFDGSFDYSYSIPFPVSGICANGVISCEPGTWNNCHYYKWIADSEGRVSLQQTGATDLGGCYCSNASCGSGTSTTVFASIILKDLGGGAVGAAMSAKNSVSITGVQVNNMDIIYYGQDTGSPNTAKEISADVGKTDYEWYAGSTGPNRYYDPTSGSALLSAAGSEEVGGMADTSSMYNLIATSGAAQANPVEQKTCTINRVVSLDIDNVDCKPVSMALNSSNIFSGCGNPSVPGYPYNGSPIYVTQRCYSCSGGSSDNTAITVYLPPGVQNSITYCGPQGGDSNDKLVIGQESNDVCISLRPNRKNHLRWATINDGGSCSNYNDYGSVTICYPSTVYQCLSRTKDESSNYFAVDAASCRSNCVDDVITVNIDNKCLALENDSRCRLKDEWVDGIQTWSNYASTGFIPVGQICKTFCGLDTHTLCYDWWTKKRVYVCTIESYDFTKAKKRAETISTSVKNTDVSENTLTDANYQDYRKDKSGNWIYEGSGLVVPQRDAEGGCMFVCKVKVPEIDTQATSRSENTSQYRDTNSYVFDYRKCDKEGGSYSCPVKTGETVVTDCECIDEFAEAASIIQTLQEAGKDIICSDGVRK